MTPHPLRRLACKPLLIAALLAGAGVQAQAADFLFSGTLDSGSLAGQGFAGSFSYDEPAAGFDGTVDLSAFTLTLAGQTYTLAGADAGTVPDAYFVAGSFVGLDFQDTASTDALRPQVTLVAGFTEFAQAQLGYSIPGADTGGFGSYAVTAAVPEPASAALLLAGAGLLGVMGVVGRRAPRRR